MGASNFMGLWCLKPRMTSIKLPFISTRWIEILWLCKEIPFKKLRGKVVCVFKNLL